MKNTLKIHRAIHQFTQEQLARKVDVTLTTINAMEANKHCPSLKLAMRIAILFDTPVDDIFIMEEKDYDDPVRTKKSKNLFN